MQGDEMRQSGAAVGAASEESSWERTKPIKDENRQAGTGGAGQGRDGTNQCIDATARTAAAMGIENIRVTESEIDKKRHWRRPLSFPFFHISSF